MWNPVKGIKKALTMGRDYFSISLGVLVWLIWFLALLLFLLLYPLFLCSDNICARISSFFRLLFFAWWARQGLFCRWICLADRQGDCLRTLSLLPSSRSYIVFSLWICYIWYNRFCVPSRLKGIVNLFIYLLYQRLYLYSIWYEIETFKYRLSPANAV